MNGPLSHLKVLELTTFVSACTAGRLFTDWGSEVIKVETYAGDPWRLFGTGAFTPSMDLQNPVYDIDNSMKKDILIDLKTEKGMKIMHQLLAEADVFVTNNRPKSLMKMGLDYDSLKDKYPRLIYGLLTGYGLKGKDKDQPGYDGVAVFTRCGLLYDTAEPSGFPAIAPGAMGDHVSGSMLFGGICAALLVRERTGKGDFVDISLYGTGIWMNAFLATTTQKPFNNPYPKTRYTQTPLQTFYKCSDGEWVSIQIMEYERYIKQLFDVLEIPEYKDDPRFQTRLDILKNRADVIKILEDAFIKYDSKEAMRRLTSADITHDRLRHSYELADDEQALANDYMRKHTYETGNTVSIPQSPLRARCMGTPAFSRCPMMGEHTEDILGSLGYSEAEIKGLMAEDVVRGKTSIEKK
jgi:crotonobetainyl-CoA:carnitine CoA-transferase CaiB-like acyl-CoA transferase